MQTKPRKQIAKPFKISTDFTVKPSKFSILNLSNFFGIMSLPADVAIYGTNHLKDIRDRLTSQEGFLSPAIRFYATPQGKIGGIVFDATGKIGALGKTTPLLPEGAKPFKQILFSPDLN